MELEQQKVVEQPKKFSRHLWLGLNLAISLGALVFAGLSYWQQPSFASFDIKGTTDQFLQQLQNSSLNEEDKAKRIKRFEYVLHKTIAEYKQDNVIILVKPAVITNIPDKSVEIRSKIAQKMKQAKSD